MKESVFVCIQRLEFMKECIGVYSEVRVHRVRLCVFRGQIS